MDSQFFNEGATHKLKPCPFDSEICNFCNSAYLFIVLTVLQTRICFKSTETHNSSADPGEEETVEEPELLVDPKRKTSSQPKNSETPNLAIAIQLMTDILHNCDTPAPAKKAKAKEPDAFDGSDSCKLNNFVLLCNLYFCSSNAYDNDSAKVNFALSYLCGTALDYFEPTLMESIKTPD